MPTLQFKGKSAVWNHHLSVPYHTLEKDTKKSLKGTDDAENLIIEGDNLLALKALLPQYQGKVKCIYIDPPYNTGNEGWVYNDNVSSPMIKDWLGKAVGKEGEDLTRHDKWLCMMTPRLKLLRDLLTDDGVLFVSIDEVEAHHLRMVCEEIFGSDNYAGEIVWQNSSKNDQSYISIQHEYILAFVKNKSVNKGEWTEKKEGLEEIYRAFSSFHKKYKNDWKKIHEEAVEWFSQFSESNPIYGSKHYTWMDEKGPYFPADISGPNFGQYVYDLVHPITKKTCKAPASGWRYPEKTMMERVRQDLVHFGVDETTIPNNKTYLKDTEYQSLTSVKYRDGRVASQQLAKLMGANVFTNPKDVDLIKTLFRAVGVVDNDIVLDSFAGSGTTAQAVLELNVEDKKLRKCVLVQLPEEIKKDTPAYKAGYRWVHEITRDRVKKVIDKFETETGFTYSTLGPAIDAESLLEGKLPKYKEFAKYVYYLATGKNLSDEKKIKEQDGFVGAAGSESIWLLYKQDMEALKTLAITLDWAQEANKKEKGRKVVYAPACYLDDETLDQYNIKFVSIPYNLFERQS